jgi:hypothetical protein
MIFGKILSIKKPLQLCARAFNEYIITRTSQINYSLSDNRQFFEFLPV